MEIKLNMHTLLNRIATLLLLPMLGVFVYFMNRDAATPTLKIVGIVTVVALAFFAGWYLVFKYGAFNYAVFKNDVIELHSPFKLIAVYKYSEVLGCAAFYTSTIEVKKYVTFTSIEYNSVVEEVDTSKRGNILAVNKMKVVYVPATKELLNFLKTKTDLKFYVKK